MKKQGQTILSRDILLVLAASFFYMASPKLVTALVAGFSESLGANGTAMGIISGLMGLCSLFCWPFAGNLADKISKYKLSFIGAGLMSLACLGYVLASKPWLVAVARVVQGIGFAACSICMSTWVANLLPREKLGSGMGLYGTVSALSMALAPAAGVAIFNHFGYRTAFIVATACMASTLVIIQFVQDKVCRHKKRLKQPQQQRQR